MYQFSKKLKTLSFALIILGFIGIVYGFLSAPKNVDDVKAMMSETHHEQGHAAEQGHDSQTKHVSKDDANHHSEVKEEAHGTESHSDAHESDHNDANHDSKEAVVVAGHDDHDEHAKHLLHQLQNRPWSALYVAILFFLLISLGVLVFYVSQVVASAGWSIVLFRVMEAITANILPTSIFLLIFLILTAGHANHLFVWMKEGATVVGHENYDALIDLKSPFLNIPFWMIRSVIYLVGWNIFRFLFRKYSLLQDNSIGDIKIHNRIFNMGVAFLLFFMVSESGMAWDWLMSLDPHWFSSLYGWYVLATFLVSGVVLIAMVTIYLKSQGYLEYVNDSHLHDLAKFIFGFSIFWTYLWFSQFMLIWYSDMAEETVYYVQRFEEYKVPFLGMVAMNFVFPFLVLMNSDFKRLPWFILMAGVVVLAGHYIDIYIMVMPGTVGGSWFIGIPEIGAVLFFLGIFIYTVFSALEKAPLLAKGNPYLKESEGFHY
ncbi:MAG: DUF4779 domain-containing protein [Flavobacteriaceae bacterium]|nr:DUF4779 domain-containing protein [Flavobacteriaceae bacterium]